MLYYLLQGLIIFICLFSYKYGTYLCLKPFRRYWIFVVAQIIAQDFTKHDKQLNWDIMWSLELINIVWINYIVCKLFKDNLPKFEKSFILQSCPYFVGFICFLNLPFHKTGLQMCQFEIYSLALSFILLIISLYYSITEECEEIVICLGLYLCFDLISFLLWQHGLYSQKSFLLAELAGFLLILWAVFRYEVHSDIGQAASSHR